MAACFKKNLYFFFVTFCTFFQKTVRVCLYILFLDMLFMEGTEFLLEQVTPPTSIGGPYHLQYGTNKHSNCCWFINFFHYLLLD